ncbi:Heterokaryon incompatibility protein (HET) domain containing protein [Rhypophila decipiens]
MDNTTTLPFVEVSEYDSHSLSGVSLSVVECPPAFAEVRHRSIAHTVLSISRAFNHSWVDSDLVRVWKQHCDSNHAGSCSRTRDYKALASSRPIWLVDTVGKCIVRTRSNEPYVALSYVWGSVVMLKAVQSNIGILQRPGSLANDKARIDIPATIRDAMGWVHALGERYLWVDCLCIVQDVEEEKEREIAKMPGIFANATVTIIAAQGSDAAYGLRGLKGVSEPRTMDDYATFALSTMNIELLFPCPNSPKKSAFRAWERKWRNHYQPTIWSKRGWTFQEEVFSRRALVFDKGCIRWECMVDKFREGELPWSDYPDRGDCCPPPNLERSMKAFLHSVRAGDRVGWLDTFRLTNVIQKYNLRQFSYPQDILWGFSGIDTVLKSSFMGPFVGGLPSGLFNIALLWTRNSYTPPPPTSATVCLPSWSWAGWECELNRMGDAKYLRDFFSPRTWDPTSKRSSEKWEACIRGHEWRCKMTTDPKEEGFLIRDLYLENMDLYLLDAERPCPPGWSRHALSESFSVQVLHPQQTFFYKHVSHRLSEFAFPLPLFEQADDDSPAMLFTPFITCRTRKAELFIAAIDDDGYFATLCDKTGSWAGRLTSNMPFDEALRQSVPTSWYRDDISTSSTSSFIPKPFDLVEISFGRFMCSDTGNDHLCFAYPLLYCPNFPKFETPVLSGCYEYFNVLWVEWIDGVAYRKGLGKVWKDACDAAEKEDIDLILG